MCLLGFFFFSPIAIVIERYFWIFHKSEIIYIQIGDVKMDFSPGVTTSCQADG